MLKASEECLEKIKEIENDVLRHIEMHHEMPTSVALSKRELMLVKEARKAGIIPEVEYKGEKKPISIRYGGYYG
jgi:hypothetical protein